jgi:hypothetical protein
MESGRGIESGRGMESARGRESGGRRLSHGGRYIDTDFPDPDKTFKKKGTGSLGFRISTFFIRYPSILTVFIISCDSPFTIFGPLGSMSVIIFTDQNPVPDPYLLIEKVVLSENKT